MTGVGVAAWLASLPRGPRTRFAPSPTGELHLGHVVNAIYTWGLAQRADGEVVLRVEDHDRGRSRQAYEVAILEDLSWLGFALRHGSSGVPVRYRQSDRGTGYEKILDRLRDQGVVYACNCSRRQLAAAGGVPGRETAYPGTCRDRNLVWGAGVGIRVRLASRMIRFEDGSEGPQEQRPAEQCGDLLVRDRDGNWTYQFAVVADDLDQGIDLVVRGRDLLASTGRQIQLAGLVDRPTVAGWWHHPLILADNGRKLSKRERAAGVRTLRESGARPEEVLGMAAHAVGLLDRVEPLAVSDLGALFA